MDYITASAFEPLCVSACLYMHRIETIPFLSFPSSTTFGLYIGGSTRVGLMSEIRMSLGEPPIESCGKTKPTGLQQVAGVHFSGQLVMALKVFQRFHLLIRKRTGSLGYLVHLLLVYACQRKLRGAVGQET